MATAKIERVVKKLLSPAIVLVILMMLATSCGESIGTLLSGGGISGTGRFLGIIAGFGSIFVNGVEIEITNDTNIILDDGSADESDLKVGMKVEILANNNVASSVTYKSEIKGPVQSINTVDNSFSVLGQTVKVDGTTVYDGEGLTGFAALQVDNIVEVSGFADASAQILASFVELEDSNLDEFKVIGTVSDLDESLKTFTINNITVDYNVVQNPPALSEGSSVEVEGRLVGTILEATEIEIEDFSYSDGDEVEMEGVITSLISQSDFVVNNQRVQTESNTEYEHGTALNISQNVRVEIKGSVNSSNILIAKKVEFRFLESQSIEIEGAVQSVDTDNATVMVFGVTIHVDTNTALKDEVLELRPFTLVNIQNEDFLEIGGFVDEQGNIIAARLERKESPDQGEYEIRGPVGTETPDTGLNMLGISVDVSGAEFEDLDDMPIAASEFFDTIDPDDIVEVKGSFEGDLFTATEVEIEFLITE